MEDTTETARSASYLDIHPEIYSEGLDWKSYDKGDGLNFPIVNFPFINTDSPLVPMVHSY